MVTRRQFTASLSATVATSALLGTRSVFGQSKSITYVGWSHDEAASKPTLSAMFDGYRKANPEVKLDIIGFPWAQMQQNILLRMRSGQALDVVQVQERWLPQFATTGKLVDMNDVFGKGQLAKMLDPGALRLGEFKGKQLGIPWTFGSLGMVANTKVLADAGFSSPPQTIDAFLEALRAIKKSQPQSVPYSMTTKNNNSMSPDFQVWLWTFGGKLFDDKGKVLVNSVAGVRALTFLTDLVKEGLAAKDIDRPDARRMFAQHQTGFYHDAPLARGFARNNSGKGKDFDPFVISMPTPVLRAGDIPQSLSWGHLLTMFTDGKRIPDKASPQAKLIADLTTNDVNQLKYFGEVGLFPVTISALEPLKANDKYLAAWATTARYAERDETSLWSNAADLTTIIGEEVQSALLGQKTAQAAIETMAKRLEVKMAELPKS